MPFDLWFISFTSGNQAFGQVNEQSPTFTSVGSNNLAYRTGATSRSTTGSVTSGDTVVVAMQVPVERTVGVKDSLCNCNYPGVTYSGGTTETVGVFDRTATSSVTDTVTATSST